MRATNKERVETLLKRRAQLDAEILRLQTQSKKEARKIDTRRKILIGAIMMQEMEQRSDFDVWVRKLLAERLTKTRDRMLFGLPKL